MCPDCYENKDDAGNSKLSLSREINQNKDKQIKCKFCNTKLYDFKKVGFVGCGQCYLAFKKH
ncbi:MAG: hypothetical protein ACOCP4_06435, partial [Candidatus Woesearchaeota archaeon]